MLLILSYPAEIGLAMFPDMMNVSQEGSHRVHSTRKLRFDVFYLTNVRFNLTYISHGYFRAQANIACRQLMFILHRLSVPSRATCRWAQDGKMNMDWILKALVGAGAVILVHLFAQSKSYFIAGLVPLFPTFALISHYLVGTQRSLPELKETIVFGMFSLVPYFLYLVALYFLVGRFRLLASLAGATVAWIISAAILVAAWNKG